MNTYQVVAYPKDFSSFINSEVSYDCSAISSYEINSKSVIDKDIINRILVDQVLESDMLDYTKYDFTHMLKVDFKSGVTDNTAISTIDAFKLFGIEVVSLHYSKLYFFNTSLSKDDILEKAMQVLFNPLVHDYQILTKVELLEVGIRERIELTHNQLGRVSVIDLDISDKLLHELNTKRCLALSLKELKVIRDYYIENESKRKKMGLPSFPTDVELECIAQTWSEHCKHKIFNARINFTNRKEDKTEVIDSIFSSFIKKATKEIKEENKLDWLISVFHDNAGIIRFDEKLDICFKVETHNSPSALDPYGGALTGILGVNRDILGCGLGAKPIANTNVFCLGAPGLFNRLSPDKVPRSLISPENILAGVHKGVEDGGNKSGIPTINGAMSFHDSYCGKPLIFVGSVGVMPQRIGNRDSFIKEISAGDLIYVGGGRVGKDGIHGATFSSIDLNDSSPLNAVQIGNPIIQKRLSDFLLEARDLGLIKAITDNGAGGMSSSIGEMAQLSNGADLFLDKAPLKYSGLDPWEILISESQERMSFAIEKENSTKFEELALRRGVEVSHVGEFTNSGSFKIFYHDECVGHIDLDFLHEGVPKMELSAIWDEAYVDYNPFNRRKDLLSSSDSLENILKRVMSHGDIASKERWIRKYDHEVGGNSALRPLESIDNTSVNHCGIISLERLGGRAGNGLGLGVGMAQRVGKYDPYLMAQLSVDEAVRNIICHGVNPMKIALLDNFCWPNPVDDSNDLDRQRKMGALVLASKGLYDISKIYSTPLISGKDSMKNDYFGKSRDGSDLSISVLPTLLVSSIGQIELDNITGSHIPREGLDIFVIGSQKGGLLGSILEELYQIDSSLPHCDPVENRRVFQVVHQLITEGILSHCGDISQGGLLCALSEQLFLSRSGIDIEPELSLEELFNESAGRFLISVEPKHRDKLNGIINDDSLLYLGRSNKSFKIQCNQQNLDLTNIYKSWSEGVLLFNKELQYGN
ncbi:AIR synthase-related protein [Halobacteriovorax marinus]|uniref:AIR synthase-related protein n=1 Tax=Halobacteriovorax marinus TaxID=97084 RepID=UPI003A95D279